MPEKRRAKFRRAVLSLFAAFALGTGAYMVPAIATENVAVGSGPAAAEGGAVCGPLLVAQPYGEATPASEVSGSEPGSIAAEGICGDGVNWTLYDSGLLRIYGKGTLYSGDVFRDAFDKRKVISVVVSDGVIANTYSNSLFADLSNAEAMDLSGLDTSSVENMSEMFFVCSSLQALDISSFDTSSVTDMFGMFWGCSSLQALDLSRFDTSSVENMQDMFSDCSALEALDLSSFDTSSVTDMGGMFAVCPSLASIRVSDRSDFSKAPFPVPNPSAVPGATRKWVNTEGKVFAPDEIPPYVADTYTAEVATGEHEHTPGNWVVVKEPTVDSEGLREKRCTVCGTVLESEPIPKLDAPTVAVSGVALDKSEADIVGRDFVRLNVTVLPDNAANKVVRWSSSDERVATVDEGGVVTSVGKGTAVITVTSDDGGKTASCEVTVSNPAISLSFDKTGLSLKRGEQTSLALTAQGVLEGDVDDVGTIEWASSDAEIASVAGNGLSAIVNGVKAGTAIVTARATVNGTELSASCVIDVTIIAVESVAIPEASKMVLLSDEPFRLTAIVLPVDADNAAVAWSSSDSDVATVDATGLVTPVSVGTAVIMASAGGLSDACELTVADDPETIVNVESVALNGATLAISDAKPHLLEAIIAPENASNKGVSWASSDTSVATVSDTGLVTPVRKGGAIITVTTEDGGKTASCQVTVSNPATSLVLDKTELPLKCGGQGRLSLAMKGALEGDVDGIGAIGWASSDSRVATVAGSGYAATVSALREGSATITASAGGLSASCLVRVAPTVKTVETEKGSAVSGSVTVSDDGSLAADVSDYSFVVVALGESDRNEAESALSEAAGEGGRVADAFDIYFKDASGKRVSWSDSDHVLTVRLFMTEDMKALVSSMDFVVYYVGEGDAVSPMKTRVEDGKLVFETTHFSTYAVVAKPKALSGDGQDQSGDESPGGNTDPGSDPADDPSGDDSNGNGAGGGRDQPGNGDSVGDGPGKPGNGDSTSGENVNGGQNASNTSGGDSQNLPPDDAQINRTQTVGANVGSSAVGAANGKGAPLAVTGDDAALVASMAVAGVSLAAMIAAFAVAIAKLRRKAKE